MPSSTERALSAIVEDLPVVGTDEVRPGLTAVRGTVAGHHGTVPEPLTTDDCVYAQYEIRERGKDGVAGVEYEVVEGRVDTVPFRVEDEDGAVLVDPTAVEHSGSGRVTSPLDGAGPLPLSDAATRAYAEDEGGFEPVERERLGREETTAALIHPEVHVQSTIRPGDEVYVLGEFERRSGDPPYVTAPTGGPFLVTDMSRSALVAALDRESGDVSAQVLRFALFGLILALVLGFLVLVGVAVATIPL